MRYQLGSAEGWMGSTFEAYSDEEAVTIAENAPYRETVLDIVDWRDEDGNPVFLLVVAS